MMIIRLVTISALLLYIVFLGCRAEPAPDSGFLEQPETLHTDPKMPFDDVWVKDGVDFRNYKKLLIKPVDTTYLEKLSWWDKASMAQAFKGTSVKNEVSVLGDYMRTKIREHLRKQMKDGYQEVEAPDSETLVIETALVEVVPTKPWLNAIGYLAIGALSTGTTAFEGRFKDGGTAEDLFRCKDREFGKMAVVSVADFQWYAHSKDTIDDWADRLAKLCTTAPGSKIARPRTVTLRPW